MSVQFSSIAIGLVVGWVAPPRAMALPVVWLLRMAGLTLAIWLASLTTPLLAGGALIGALISFSLRALLDGSLQRRGAST